MDFVWHTETRLPYHYYEQFFTNDKYCDCNTDQEIQRRVLKSASRR